MKIVSIFAEQFCAFDYDTEAYDAYRSLLELWNDIDYLLKFYEENKKDIPRKYGKYEFVDAIQDAAADINETLENIVGDPERSLDEVFKPFHNQEYQTKVLSIRKNAKQYLRLYAIRIESDIYVVTGGAIKFTRTVQERPHTNRAYEQLKTGRDYLETEGIFDEDSFVEWKNEQL